MDGMIDDKLPDVDGVYILVGKVMRQAIKDARKGNREAQEFLSLVAPDIVYSKPAERGKAKSVAQWHGKIGV